MAKPKSPFQAPRNAPQPKAHRYIEALFLDDFGRLSKLTVKQAHGFTKKKFDRASQTLQLMSESAERKAFRASDRDFRRADRAVEAELREADQRRRVLSRRLKTSVRPAMTVHHIPPKERTRLWPYAAVALPKYDGPILDRRAERAVFARFRYYSRRTARPGVSGRVVAYIYNGAALDAEGKPYSHSNMGLEIDETHCAFDHLEQINWSAQEGAKLLMHGILAMDYRQTPDEMMDCATRWAEEALGRFDLPYLVTLHEPPAYGDHRNWHAHVVWSFRPMVRTSDHEWLVGEMLRTDLDNPQAMKLMREAFAAVMTDVSFEAGQNQVWTAKSNAARGIVEEPQVHVGAALTNRAREGEHVAIVEENHERVLRSKAARLDEDLRHIDEALARQQGMDHAILAHWVRVPEVPHSVPQAIIAAQPAIGHCEIMAALPSGPPSITTPVTLPAVTIEPATSSISPGPITAPRAEGDTIRTLLPPMEAVQHAMPDFANLRISPAPAGSGSIIEALPLPEPMPDSMPVWLTTVQMPGALARAEGAVRAMPSSPGSVESATLSLRPVPAPVPYAPDRIDDLVTYVADVRARHRKDDVEDEAALLLRRRDAEIANAEQARLVALNRLFQMLRLERHYIAREDGRPVVSKGLLDRFGHTSDALADAHAQKDLMEIVYRQDAEISRIADYVRRAPHQLQHHNENWSLSDKAPPEMRQLVKAWGRDATMRAAFNRTVRMRPDPAAGREHSPVVQPGSGWIEARLQRQRAMVDDGATERIDGNGLKQPGRSIDGAGRDHQPRNETPIGNGPFARPTRRGLGE